MLGIFAVGLGCGSGATEESSPSEWRSFVQELKANGGWIYSPIFYADPKEIPDPGLLVIGQVRNPEEVCAQFSGMPDRDSAYWELKIELSRSSAGTYEIVSDKFPIIISGRLDDGEEGRRAASVMLALRVEGEYIARFKAASGTVVLPETVNNTHFERALPLSIELEADFPEHAIQQLNCHGGAAVDGSQFIQQCECKDAEGLTSTCELSLGSSDCCVDLDAPRLALSFTGSPAFCSSACQGVVGLTNHCASLGE